jgi:hypothetical protein
MVEFESFKKIPRLFRECIITEKLDGTNAQILIPDDDGPILVGSRNRWITPGKTTDNYGFAAFVENNKDALRRLGPGRHFGEWWGVGIARGYNLTERRWSLFNTNKPLPEGLPNNVYQVPVLRITTFHTVAIDSVIRDLQTTGSIAAPGYMNPEGVVVFHKASGQLFKYTFDGDGNKGPNKASPEEV